jgi:hypothetical protein
VKARLLKEAEQDEQMARSKISPVRATSESSAQRSLQVRALRRCEMLGLSDYPRRWINKAAT